MVKYFAIKDNKIVSRIDTAPFSKENMDKLCKDFGYDTWFELDSDAAIALMEVRS